MVTAGACVAACNVAAVACYAAAGLIFGTITAGPGAPPAALACNAALATCMQGCMALQVVDVVAVGTAAAGSAIVATEAAAVGGAAATASMALVPAAASTTTAASIMGFTASATSAVAVATVAVPVAIGVAVVGAALLKDICDSFRRKHHYD